MENRKSSTKSTSSPPEKSQYYFLLCIVAYIFTVDPQCDITPITFPHPPTWGFGYMAEMCQALTVYFNLGWLAIQILVNICSCDVEELSAVQSSLILSRQTRQNCLPTPTHSHSVQQWLLLLLRPLYSPICLSLDSEALGDLYLHCCRTVQVHQIGFFLDKISELLKGI